MSTDRTEPAAPAGAPAWAAAAPGGQPFWRSWTVGERVIVRYRLDVPPGTDAATGTSGAPGHLATGPSLTDALGDLLAVDDHGVTVRTRRGDVAVPATAITLGKRVPPPPPRRSRAPRPTPAEGDTPGTALGAAD